MAKMIDTLRAYVDRGELTQKTACAVLLGFHSILDGRHWRSGDELMMVILPLLPDAVISEDADGQIVINTGLQEGTSGLLDSMEVESE